MEYITDYPHYFISKIMALTEHVAVKVISSFAFAVSSFLFGGLYTQALLAVVMLMFFDTILGVMAAKKEGQVISSRRFGASVIKGIVYFLSISSGYFVDLTIPGNFVQSTMIGFVAMTEFISILENVGRLGYNTPKKLLNQLRQLRDQK